MVVGRPHQIHLQLQASHFEAAQGGRRSEKVGATRRYNQLQLYRVSNFVLGQVEIERSCLEDPQLLS